jgi:hypothetical protein
MAQNCLLMLGLKVARDTVYFGRYTAQLFLETASPPSSFYPIATDISLVTYSELQSITSVMTA